MSSSPPAITSLANPRVKAAVRLRDRRERESTGLTLIDGARELRQALAAGATVETVFVARAQVNSDEARAALRDADDMVPDIVEVSEAVIAKLAFGDRSDGIVAIARAGSTDLESLRLRPGVPLVVVVEGVEKPGNLGAILRTADGAGASGLIAADPLTDLFNPNAVRASLGTIFRIPIAAASTSATLDWLTTRGITPIAARVDAAATYTGVDMRGPVALVLGSEATGLSGGWDDPRVTPVGIPMLGTVDSLNVSVAAAIMLYEAVRQRT
jgi:RNA methyltransferase, TrmH family